MASLDDEHPGIRNGGRVRGRRRARTPDDERPRGFKPQRMRQLWDDIDEARDKLGLGAASGAAPSTWSVGALVGRVLEVTASATTWVSGLVPASVPRRACGAGGWLAQVPILGRLLALMPGVASRAE